MGTPFDVASTPHIIFFSECRNISGPQLNIEDHSPGVTFALMSLVHLEAAFSGLLPTRSGTPAFSHGRLGSLKYKPIRSRHQTAIINFSSTVMKYGQGRGRNLGEDSDTVGAVTGQHTGALYGRTGIPRRWLAQLTRGPELDSPIRLLLQARPIPATRTIG